MIVPRIRRSARLAHPSQCQYQTFTSSAQRRGGEAHTSPSPRWLSDTKARVGKCITFGMPLELVDEAGSILKEISNDWRNLVAGSEGFLTDKRRAGLHKHAIVWGEQDVMGHVNNVQYVRYAETGRTNWTRLIGQNFDVAHRKQWESLLSSAGIGLILKSIKVEFKFPMTWPDRISVYHKFRNQPTASTSSLIMDVIILSEAKQRPAARCYEDCAIYDYRHGQKTALPPFMLNQFAQIWDLQEAAKREYSAKRTTIDRRVRDLERQTWDRPDAREHLGSAAT